MFITNCIWIKIIIVYNTIIYVKQKLYLSTITFLFTAQQIIL